MQLKKVRDDIEKLTLRCGITLQIILANAVNLNNKNLLIVHFKGHEERRHQDAIVDESNKLEGIDGREGGSNTDELEIIAERENDADVKEDPGNKHKHRFFAKLLASMNLH